MFLGSGQANFFQKSPQKAVKSRERYPEKWQLGGLRIANFSSGGIRWVAAQSKLPRRLIALSTDSRAVISGQAVVINVGSGQAPNPCPAM